MTSALLKRLHRKDEGFTLIELMVVVLIIAILIAIAIPTFLGARTSAQNRAAQSDLNTALTAEKTYYTDHQAYSATVADMQAIEPSLGWQTTVPTTNAGNAVGMDTSSGATPAGQEVCLSAYSASGTTYYLVDVQQTTGSVNPGTYFGKAAPTCDGTALPAGFTNSSSTGW